MFFKLSYPWECISSIVNNKETSTIGRNSWCSQIVNSGRKSVTNASTGKLFPVKELEDNKVLVELPGPSNKGDSSRQIKINIENDSHNLKFFPTDESNTDSNLKNLFEIFFDKILDNNLSIFREGLKVDKTMKQNIFWEEIVNLIDGNADEDPAKYALVVDLSRPPELAQPVNYLTLHATTG